MTRQEKIDALNAQIESAKTELEFLNDSGTFYEMDLGTGRKNVLILDFAASDGIRWY